VRLRGQALATAATVSILAAVVLAVAAGPAFARRGIRVVRYDGVRLSVPAAWPVFDLRRAPRTCVRFDRHAIYLGVPSSDQRCPAHAVGRTEALLLEPRPGLASAATAGARAVAGATGIRGRSAEVVALGRRLLAVATWGSDRALLQRVLGRAPGRVSARPSKALRGAKATRQASRSAVAAYGARVASGGLSAVSGSRTAHLGLERISAAAAHSARGPVAHAAEATYTGLGFDACTAPSQTAMSAWWAASPYRAIGVYVGGTNAACSQPNLTPAWVQSQVLAGWHLIPTYVGLQGVGSCNGSCATITPSKATAEGTAAADDAIAQVKLLGIGAGNPIYDDMEAYTDPGPKGRYRKAVLAFLAAWTTELHAGGYLSGVYGSGTSVITDLVGEWNNLDYAGGARYPEPDDLWIAHWNGAQTTSDAYVPAADWPGQARLHQYSGGQNQTYCGQQLNIDGDYADGATADAPAPYPYPNGTFVSVIGSLGQTTIYRIAGGAPVLWTQPTTGWPVTQTTAAQLAELPGVPADGTVVEGVPSGTYWSFAGGQRSQLSAPPVAAVVKVDDAGLESYPAATTSSSGGGGGGVGLGGGSPLCQTPKRSGSCVVPRLKHLSLVAARHSLTRANCRLGTVRRPHWPWRKHRLRVYGQSAPVASRHRAGYKVNIRLI
jgi:Rv2525c-like, glycoside hydrolase-like domain